MYANPTLPIPYQGVVEPSSPSQYPGLSPYSTPASGAPPYIQIPMQGAPETVRSTTTRNTLYNRNNLVPNQQQSLHRAQSDPFSNRRQRKPQPSPQVQFIDPPQKYRAVSSNQTRPIHGSPIPYQVHPMSANRSMPLPLSILQNHPGQPSPFLNPALSPQNQYSYPGYEGIQPNIAGPAGIYPRHQHPLHPSPRGYDPNQLFVPHKVTNPLKDFLGHLPSLQREIDVTNKKTRNKNIIRKNLQRPYFEYKFNPSAFETAFSKARVMKYLQLVTHQIDRDSPINEYFLLRPFSQTFVSNTGLRISVDYNDNDELYEVVFNDNIDPSTAEDYVGVRSVGVIIDEPILFDILNFIPLPLAGGKERKPEPGDKVKVPVETFRGWSSLVIMEARRRGALY